ncbi:MAG: O-antigen ligase family protein [Bacteroidetes bacterium]|nr:O-antigen ligase family protein [Bacteroidota bacterium]
MDIKHEHNLAANKRNQLSTFVVIFFFTLLLLPGIPVMLDHIIYFRLEDFVLLGAFLFLLIKDPFLVLKTPVTFALYAAAIMISIGINFTNTSYNDFFEIAKVVKWAMIFLIFARFVNADLFKKTFEWVFYALIVFNVFQYFNIFHFNTLIEPLYSDSEQLGNAYFVSYTGEFTRRLLGTLGNPNNNAIVLAVFALHYAFDWKSPKSKTLFSIAIALLLMCQSRTIILALGAVFFMNFLLNFKEYKLHLEKLTFVLVIYGVVHFINLDYLEMIFQGKAFAESKSVEGRMESWGTMISESRLSPFFGYGPNKDYLYSKGFSPENEFIYTKARYGYVGLTTFILLIISPYYFFRRQWQNHLLFFSVTLIFIVTSFFNCPYSSLTLSAFYFMLFGMEYSKLLADKPRIR